MCIPKCVWQFFFRVFAAVSLLIIFALGILAQSGTTSISGTIADQNGAAVPGATVTITNPETGFTRTTTASAEGKYGFPGIAPATYQLEVTASNFKKSVNKNAAALVEKPLELNVSLEAGDVSVVVDVTSNTIESIVNTQDASLGNNFVPEQ